MSDTTLLLKGVSTHSSIDNVDQVSESMSVYFTNSDLFQPKAEVSTCFPNDAALCKSVKQSHTGPNEEISPCSIWKLKGPMSFIGFADDESKLIGITVFLETYLVD